MKKINSEIKHADNENLKSLKNKQNMLLWGKSFGISKNEKTPIAWLMVFFGLHCFALHFLIHLAYMSENIQ